MYFSQVNFIVNRTHLKLFASILFSISLIFQSLSAQESDHGFKFDLSVRYRFELWNGLNAKNYGDESDDAIGNLNDKILLQRIIPGVTYSGQKITAGFHLQDSRAFGWSLRDRKYPDLYKICDGGADSPYYFMNPQEEYFDIYDVYVEFKELFKNLTVKIGRQKIFFNDYRIFEPSLWGNAGRWNWDAIRISYKKGENTIDIFGGGTKINNPHRISIPFTETEFWGGGVYSHFRLQEWLIAEPFYGLKTRGSIDFMKFHSINRSWAGVKLFNPAEQNLIYDFVYVHEFGSEDGKRINALGYVTKLGYRFSSLHAGPALSIGYSYASGGSRGDTDYTFDPVYGARGKFYGWMNIISWSNIRKPEIVLEFKPSGNRTWIEMKYSLIYIPEPDDCQILNTMKLVEGKHHLGNETDILIRYQPSAKWQFTGILGYFRPGDIEPINEKSPEAACLLAFQVLFEL